MRAEKENSTENLEQENQALKELVSLENKLIYRQQKIMQLNQISLEIAENTKALQTLTKWIHYFATSGGEGSDKTEEPPTPEEPD